MEADLELDPESGLRLPSFSLAVQQRLEELRNPSGDWELVVASPSHQDSKSSCSNFVFVEEEDDFPLEKPETIEIGAELGTPPGLCFSTSSGRENRERILEEMHKQDVNANSDEDSQSEDVKYAEQITPNVGVKTKLCWYCFSFAASLFSSSFRGAFASSSAFLSFASCSFLSFSASS